MAKFINENKKYDFTALVPMGGEHEGKIALHSTKQRTIEEAEMWAKGRFSRLSVIILDSDYPDLYPSAKSVADENYIRKLFEDRLHEEFRSLKKVLKINNADIAAIVGLSYDSVKTMTQPNKELPSWAKAMIYTWKQSV